MYYDTVGNQINVNNFLKEYNSHYFFLTDYNLEGQIMQLFKKSLTQQDIALILSWKLGNPICQSGNDYYVNSRNGKIYANDVLVAIKNSGVRIPIKNDVDAKKMHEALCKVNGIGGVYAVSLLYFLSEGYYPMYDRFARMGLTAIMNGTQIRGTVNQEVFSWSRYLKYINDLVSQFGTSWRTNIQKNRELDRALWAYGHMFK